MVQTSKTALLHMLTCVNMCKHVPTCVSIHVYMYTCIHDHFPDLYKSKKSVSTIWPPESTNFSIVHWLPGARRKLPHSVTYNQTLILGPDWSNWSRGGLSLVTCRIWKSVTDQTCRQLVTIININSQFHQLPISRCQLSGSDQGKSVHNERKQHIHWCVSLWSRSGQCGFILSWWMN